jgi:hypothetical protein
MRTFLDLLKQNGLPPWMDGRHPQYLTESVDGASVLMGEDGGVLDRETFLRMRDELDARILTNEPGTRKRTRGAGPSSAPSSTPMANRSGNWLSPG